MNSSESLALPYMPDYLKTVVKELEAHFLEPFSLDDTAFKVGAYATGVNQVIHFINLFKKREGITPLQYRKEWKET